MSFMDTRKKTFLMTRVKTLRDIRQSISLNEGVSVSCEIFDKLCKKDNDRRCHYFYECQIYASHIYMKRFIQAGDR